ncbi:Hypothetical protein PACV_53 [Pacmanvirus A23]|uniref:Hypothetical protein n=1 Tax=Pacmanvirus A23 TaxID=1932881 RepID=UPI000A09522F|nr:Hypothetical protein B9W72_gp053 [Pacmanvirus A23]SIP85770.1 Hypothetical protein PACV_53 [Pacmanvirus A23]
MESASERLSIIFEKLKSTDLVKKGIINANTINRFCNILNLATPVTREDRIIADVFRFMYARNRKAFYKNIQINNLSHMVLFTDGLPIVNVLRLRGVVVINWNARQNEFIVKKYNNTKKNIEINSDTEELSSSLNKEIISDEIYLDMINNGFKEETKITSWADAVSDEESEEFDSDN